MAPVQRICRFYKAIQKRFSEMVGCGKFVTCRGTCPLVERSDIVTLETIGKLWEFVRSLCAALFRSWEFQLAAIDICGSFGEAGSSCRTKSAEPCIIDWRCNFCRRVTGKHWPYCQDFDTANVCIHCSDSSRCQGS